MTDSPNDPAGPAGSADPDAPASARRHPVRQLARAMVSPDSYGSVLLLILFTYVFSTAVTAPWAASLVVTVQIATVWVALRVSQAHRGVRRAAGLLLLISALAAAVNLFAGGTAGSKAGIWLVSALLYLLAPVSIARRARDSRPLSRENAGRGAPAFWRHTISARDSGPPTGCSSSWTAGWSSTGSRAAWIRSPWRR